MRIARLHMEEDAGKLLHEGFAWSDEKSGVDLNRAGVPLVEIVSEPDLRGPEEAHAYLTALRAVLLYAAVSDVNMEEGSLRCDANVSVRPRGATALGTRAEIKNLNSFRHVARAIEYEVTRQVALVESGRQVTQETRLWNEARGETAPLRSKEDAHDYRYFPEPDLRPARGLARVARGGARLAARAAGRASADASPRSTRCRTTTRRVLTQERELADYFEAAARESGNPKAASNWIMTELLRKLKEDARPLAAAPVGPNRARRDSSSWSAPARSAARSPRTCSTGCGRPATRRLRSSNARGSASSTTRPLSQPRWPRWLRRAPSRWRATAAARPAALGWFVGQVMKQDRRPRESADRQRALEEGARRTVRNELTDSAALRPRLVSS